jgi:hypothetical protein
MVKEAIKRAAGSDPQKRVLIQFGADWNDSCKKFNWFLAQAVIASLPGSKPLRGSYVCIVKRFSPANFGPLFFSLGTDSSRLQATFDQTTLKQDHDCVAYCQKYYSYLILDAEHEANFDIMKRLGEPQWLVSSLSLFLYFS